jgi:hypothetical protein
MKRLLEIYEKLIRPNKAKKGIERIVYQIFGFPLALIMVVCQFAIIIICFYLGTQMLWFVLS